MLKTSTWIPLLLVAAAGCATVAPEPKPLTVDAPKPRLPSKKDRERVVDARREAEGLLTRQAELLHRAWVEGAAPGAVSAETALFSKETIESVRRVRTAEREPDRRQALGLLEAYLTGEQVARELEELDARVASLEAGARFEAGGEIHALRELGRLLAAEPDSGRRSALAAAAAVATRPIAAALGERNGRMEALARKLGYRDASALGAFVHQVDRDALNTLAGDLLDSTGSAFRSALDNAARRELGLEPGELRRPDLPRLFRGVTFDARYPSDGGGLEAILSTFETLGIGFDGVRRESASADGGADPACFPMRPPSDVRLVLGAAPAADWGALFLEAGCAAQAAHAEGEGFELLQLGNRASVEGLARVVEGLTESPAWLRDHTLLTVTEAEAQLAGSALRRLFLARRTAAHLLFDRERSGLAAGKAAGRSRELLEQAFLFPIAPDATADLEPRVPFAGSERFVAEILAATIEEQLESRHGERWWSSGEAGAELLRLFALGARASPDELARAAGAEGLGVGPWVRKLERRLAPLLAAPPSPEPSRAEPPPAPAPAPVQEEREALPPDLVSSRSV
ncbi:hypothetical protein [Vulgatibacter incomptus]|uniref:Chromosome partition protein smc n=1 Tax=Vulgatibacter incomptus TaxID=1391653 RepID=A0A0K1PEB9_9BACT|nr:hypothetical protein [Vulgatibacter incomptus]AKU91842.1 Chromosome partition protein smc [Vulgatibacter incomptus]